MLGRDHDRNPTPGIRTAVGPGSGSLGFYVLAFPDKIGSAPVNFAVRGLIVQVGTSRTLRTWFGGGKKLRNALIYIDFTTS